MNFAHGLGVICSSATQHCHPNLAEPPVKRQTVRLSARSSSCTLLLLQMLDQVVAAPASSLRTVQWRSSVWMWFREVRLADAVHLHVAEHCLLFLYSTISLQQLQFAFQEGLSERWARLSPKANRLLLCWDHRGSTAGLRTRIMVHTVSGVTGLTTIIPPELEVAVMQDGQRTASRVSGDLSANQDTQTLEI